MKKFLFVFFFVSFVAGAQQAYLYVRDEAKLLSPAVAEELEQKAIALEKATTVEFAVVTTPSLGEETIKDFAVRFFEKLGVGKKEKDNGVMLVVAPVERKAHVEVGYGLEGILNDAKVTRLLRENFVPHIQKGNAEEAIRQTFLAIDRVIEAGESAAEESQPKNNFVLVLFAVILISLFVLAIIFGKRGKGGGSSDSSSGRDDSGGSGSSGSSSGGSGGSFGGGRSGGGGGSVGW